MGSHDGWAGDATADVVVVVDASTKAHETAAGERRRAAARATWWWLAAIVAASVELHLFGRWYVMNRMSSRHSKDVKNIADASSVQSREMGFVPDLQDVK
jgi:hypothetical protein